MIPFTEYMPDQATYQNPGTSYVKNVRPRAKDYTPQAALAAASDALTARPQGLISVKSSSGVSSTFAGDQTKLYSLGSDLAWDDVSQSAVTYATPSTGFWQFTKYGDYILATNNVDDIQKFQIGTSTKFEDLGGSPPVAKYIATVREFVVLGSVSGDAAVVRWSSFNNMESWTVGTSQADTQTILSGDRVKAVVGGEIGYVFMENAIWRMTYEGPPTIFRFDEVEPNRGLLAPKGLIRIGRQIYYMSNEGFFVLDTTSGASTPIGAEKVDRTVYDDLNDSYLERVSTAVDPVNKLIYWSYPSQDSTDGTPDKLIMFNYVTQRWAPVEVDHELLGTTLSPGYTLDSLDSVDDLDSLPYSLDSGAWNTTSWLLTAFDTTDKLGYFNGDNMEATIDTVEFSERHRSIITNCTPVVDGAAAVKAGTRERQQDTVSFGTESSQQVNGDCPLLSSGRYHTLRTRVPSGEYWTSAQGIEVEVRTDGYR